MLVTDFDESSIVRKILSCELRFSIGPPRPPYGMKRGHGQGPLGKVSRHSTIPVPMLRFPGAKLQGKCDVAVQQIFSVRLQTVMLSPTNPPPPHFFFDFYYLILGSP